MDANEGIKLMLLTWSGDVKCHSSKLSTARHSWKDAVFGDLIQEWLDTFQKADEEIN